MSKTNLPPYSGQKCICLACGYQGGLSRQTMEFATAYVGVHLQRTCPLCGYTWDEACVGDERTAAEKVREFGEAVTIANISANLTQAAHSWELAYNKANARAQTATDALAKLKARVLGVLDIIARIRVEIRDGEPMLVQMPVDKYEAMEIACIALRTALT